VDFFHKINYSAANEDGQSEIKALSLTEKDEIVCITGSGARSLDLISAGPARVISIDFNPTQTHLLQLKLAGYRNLTWSEFMGFIGVDKTCPPTKRLETFAELQDELPESTRKFWQSNSNLIREGILYCGTWEKFLRILKTLGWPRRQLVHELFACKDLEEQKQCWQQHWDGRTWRSILRLTAWRPLWKYILREPGINFIPSDFDIYGYIYHRFNHGARTFLFKDAPYMWLLFQGHYDLGQVLPIHLSQEHFSVIKERAALITPLTGSLTDRKIAGGSPAFRFLIFPPTLTSNSMPRYGTPYSTLLLRALDSVNDSFWSRTILLHCSPGD